MFGNIGGRPETFNSAFLAQPSYSAWLKELQGLPKDMQTRTIVHHRGRSYGLFEIFSFLRRIQENTSNSVVEKEKRRSLLLRSLTRCFFAPSDLTRSTMEENFASRVSDS